VLVQYDGVLRRSISQNSEVKEMRSEGKGQRFESPRARHNSNDLADCGKSETPTGKQWVSTAAEKWAKKPLFGNAPVWELAGRAACRRGAGRSRVCLGNPRDCRSICDWPSTAVVMRAG
jgi:hypothetical protein